MLATVKLNIDPQVKKQLKELIAYQNEDSYNVSMTNVMYNSYNQFYSTVFCLLYMFRTNLVVHHQEHSIIYCITQYNRYNRVGESSCSKQLNSPIRLYKTV